MLALATLTACSSAAPNSEQFRQVTVVASPTQRVDPPLPSPVKMHDINWSVCGKMLCLKPKDAERDLINRIEIGRWMGEAQALIRFYRQRKPVSVPE